MSCRLCDGSGSYLKNGKYVECDPCRLRRSNVPKILGVGDSLKTQEKAVENARFVVESQSFGQVRALKMQIIERLLFLYNEGGLSWRDIGNKIGCDHSSVLRWSRGEDLANSPKILLKHSEKLNLVEAEYVRKIEN